MIEHHLRSFGRIKGHKLSYNQERILSEFHNPLPKIRLVKDFKKLTTLECDLSDNKKLIIEGIDDGNTEEPTQVVNQLTNIYIEIGFGAGEHIFQLIENRGMKNYPIIGCEPYINGFVKVIKYIEENSIDNVFIYEGDARDIIQNLALNSISECYILFPDPWPKTRHHKRRLVSKHTINLIMSKLSEDGSITVATDHKGYAEWIKDVLNGINYQFNILRTEEECKAHGILTRYCQKALQQHIVINVFKIYA